MNTYTVTYVIENGTWSDGTTANKTETVSFGHSPVNVPIGMTPNTNYNAATGAWDNDPEGATITGDETFTYSYDLNTYTVTYVIVNGTWSDGTTTNKTETVIHGNSPVNVPTGMLAATGYDQTTGAWVVDPTGVAITVDTTFTYRVELNTYTVT
jgi:hypothetical protein